MDSDRFEELAAAALADADRDLEGDELVYAHGRAATLHGITFAFREALSSAQDAERDQHTGRLGELYDIIRGEADVDDEFDELAATALETSDALGELTDKYETALLDELERDDDVRGFQ